MMWQRIYDELLRQADLWGDQGDRSHEEWFTIMMEELGEACRAHLHEAVENKPTDMSSDEELVQLAAIIVRALLVW